MHVVINISLAIRLRVSSLPFTSETNSARSTRLAVLDIRDKLPGPGASPTVESPGHALEGILYADFPGPSERAIRSNSAFYHLATDSLESLCIGICGVTIFEAIPRHALEFTHF